MCEINVNKFIRTTDEQKSEIILQTNWYFSYEINYKYCLTEQKGKQRETGRK